MSTKLHLRAEGNGHPIVVLVTAGQAHENPILPALMEAGAVKRPGPDGRPGRGRPRIRPDRVVGDKGYSYRNTRAYLRRRGICAVIPTRSNQRRNPRFDKQAYRLRNQVERCFNRLKRFRRIATRYEKRAVNYLAMVLLGAIMDWL